MTICKKLASAEKHGKEIEAWEKHDEYSLSPRYEITISRDGIAEDVIKAAKTTWKRKFVELVED